MASYVAVVVGAVVVGAGAATRQGAASEGVVVGVVVVVVVVVIVEVVVVDVVVHDGRLACHAVSGAASGAAGPVGVAAVDDPGGGEDVVGSGDVGHVEPAGSGEAQFVGRLGLSWTLRMK